VSNFIVGDIQGCYSGLRRLLEKANFDPANDKLWAVGDLVARGPESLETLQFLYSLGSRFETVLGNHDLHFLAIYCGIKKPKTGDLLNKLLDSPDVDLFANWLRQKPLALQLSETTMIAHAGLYPHWSIKKALKLSDEVHQQLVGKNWTDLLSAMYGSLPAHWSPSLKSYDRWRFVINAFTRMRFLTSSEGLEFEAKMAPSSTNRSLKPWFKVNNSKLKPNEVIYFGHWAALMGVTNSVNFVGLDLGYVWGNQLTLHDFEENKMISISHLKNSQ
jgi:bis(5'-nucleosyl)-tetraphosphatase (symmetrical)